MKVNFLKFGFYAIMLSMGIFMTACGNGEEAHDHEHDHDHHTEQHQHQHQHEDGNHEHDHEGHQHEQGQEHDHEGGEESSSIDKEGKEYTSAYICPMYCEGSGSDKAGTCPKCKMAYVENAEK